MYIGLHVKYPLFLLDFSKLEFSRQISENYSDIKFHGNPSSGSRVVMYGWTDGHDAANSRLSKFCDSA